MKLLLDENLSPRLSIALDDLYPGLRHVDQLGLGSANDSAVWQYAKVHGFAIVSKDADFADRSALEREPPKVIWLRVGNCTTGDIERLLRAAQAEIRLFLEDSPETCMLLGQLTTKPR